MNSKENKEPKLTYALDSSLKKLVYVEDVPNGLACNCFCPQCKEKLIARNGKDNVRQKHFAHRGDVNCNGAVMTALHLLSEQILTEEKCVMAPAYKEISASKLFFIDVEIERRNDRSDLQPDVVGVMEDGSRWLIEIKNTHEVNNDKRKKIAESNLCCLEIDVSEQELDKDSLRAFLVDSCECREWINNPIYESQIADTKLANIHDVLNEIDFADYQNNCQYDVIPSADCGLFCGLSPFGGKCIYKEREILHKGIDYVICNKERYSRDRKFHMPNYIQKESTQINLRVKDPSIKPSLSGSLPFEPFITLNEYFSQLKSMNYYETQSGDKSEILKIEKIGEKVLLLYKDNNFRTFCPFHIAIITTNNGILSNNTVADFRNSKSASEAYYKRIESMSRNVLKENEKNNPPF